MKQEEPSNYSAEVKRPVLPKTKAAGIGVLLLVSLSFGFIGGWIGAGNRAAGPFGGGANQAQQIVISEGQLISDIVEEVGPSVVSISVISNTVTRGFFGFDTPTEQQSAGTGFIIDADEGLVLTNRHVIPENATNIVVTLSDGTELDDIEVVGRTNEGDPLDIAFLRIRDSKDKELAAVKLGDSGAVQVGHRVIAIGNALGQFQNTVTSGIISGHGRDVYASDASGVDSLQNLFQTDAAINRGNSGGPLVNVRGEVIGVNTAVAAGTAQGIGFAIPINDVKGLIKSVLETGELKRPYIGVRYVMLTADYAYQYNLDVNEGAYIVPGNARNPSILPDSPAEKAGLREKDIIVKIDGTTVNRQNSLTSLIGSRSVGEEITVTVLRGGSEIEVKLRLEAMPSN